MTELAIIGMIMGFSMVWWSIGAVSAYLLAVTTWKREKIDMGSRFVTLFGLLGPLATGAVLIMWLMEAIVSVTSNKSLFKED